MMAHSSGSISLAGSKKYFKSPPSNSDMPYLFLLEVTNLSHRFLEFYRN